MFIILEIGDSVFMVICLLMNPLSWYVGTLKVCHAYEVAFLAPSLSSVPQEWQRRAWSPHHLEGVWVYAGGLVTFPGSWSLPVGPAALDWLQLVWWVGLAGAPEVTPLASIWWTPMGTPADAGARCV